MENDNIVEQETTSTPAEKPEETPVTPKPEANPFEDQNKQLYARATKAEDEARELKAKLRDLESQQVPSETVTYYDDDTKREVDALKQRLDEIQDKADLDKLYGTYPAIQDKAQEFDEFRKEFPRHKLENVAKLFLSEQGLLDTPARPGLEDPSGGARVAPSTGKLSAEDARKLREENYEGYRKLLKEGRIDLEK